MKRNAMYTHFQFFMQYDELCKVFSKINNIVFCDLRLVPKDKYMGKIYERFSDIPDVDNEKEIWLLILDSLEDFPFQSQSSVDFNRVREYSLENKRWLTLERHGMLNHEDDVRLLGEYELTIHKDSRKNPECFKIYKDIKKEIQKNCVEKYTYFFGRDTFEKSEDRIFAPFYATDDYFKITDQRLHHEVDEVIRLSYIPNS